MADPVQTTQNQENIPPGQNLINVYQSLMRDNSKNNAKHGDLTASNQQNPDSTLRTLNKISALVMLLEQFPLAPDDYALDILAWQPEPGAGEPFRSADTINTDLNNNLSSIVEELQTTSIQLVERLRLAMESGELDQLLKLCIESTPGLRARVKELTAEINS